MLFTNVWDSVSDFKDDYEDAGLYTSPVTDNGVTIKAGTKLSDASITILFGLLYAKYGNSPIANSDVNQFKFKVFGIMFQYGPSWEKKLEIQEKLRALSDEEIAKGGFNTIVFDLNNLKYMSSAGLRIVAKLKQQYDDFSIINMPDDIYEVFAMVGFADLIQISRKK